MTAPRAVSLRRLVLRRFLRRRWAVAALLVLAAVALLAVTSIGIGGLPGWWHTDYRTAGALVDGGRPTLDVLPPFLDGDGLRIGPHPFGQDDVGRDLFALTMRGAQRSLEIALLVGVVATLVGVAVGAVAGMSRGWPDGLLMRLTDVALATPPIVLAAVLARTTGGGAVVLGLLLGLTVWTTLARLVRAEILSLREREFVDAARALGAGWWHIVVHEVLPNVAGLILVNATLTVPVAVLLESSISFLGLGVQPPDTSLGRLVSDYQDALLVRPWLFWWPSLFVIVVSVSFALVGEGLREAIEPRQAGAPSP